MASTDRPTAKQLTLLRRLANERGQTFARPLSRRAATIEIQRLLRVPASSKAERALERGTAREIDVAQLRGTAIHPDEVDGYGASARWRGSDR